MKTVKFSGRNERGNFNDIGDCYNITIDIYICNKNISILQTRGFLFINITSQTTVARITYS